MTPVGQPGVAAAVAWGRGAWGKCVALGATKTQWVPAEAGTLPHHQSQERWLWHAAVVWGSAEVARQRMVAGRRAR